MSVMIVACPVCKQKLAIQDYVPVGTMLVCADCETNLKIVSVKPIKIVHATIDETYNEDARPESYG
jgi:alpha-aminoadipate/glutamate carrier protein LysW